MQEQISRANWRENLHDGRALSHTWVSLLFGDIFTGLQIGDQNGFVDKLSPT